jgi:uncharacterized protein YhaN
MISVLATIIAAFFEPLVSLGFGLLSLLFGVLTLRQVQTNVEGYRDRQEVENIFAEFETRMGTKAKSIATLMSTYDAMNPLYSNLGTFNSLVTEQEEALLNAEGEMKHNLAVLRGKPADVKNPKLVINKAQESRKNLTISLNKLNNELARTNVYPENYIQEVVDTKYDAKELSVLEEMKLTLGESFSSENSRLGNLKQRVCDLTRDTMSIVEWEDLIENLRTIQEQAMEKCRSDHAKIVSGIYITEVISDLRKQEDEQIFSALDSSSMSDPIKAFTPTYTGVKLDGEELVVFNDMQRFPLSSMSTGAKEQVLLALRIGLASHVLEDQKMFLILDDAFQHSDWKRRERLVNKLFDLSKQGWQIIYFTMDDHIRQLFEEKAKKAGKVQYQTIELPSVI